MLYYYHARRAALGGIGSNAKDAVPALIRIAQNRKNDPRVRESAAQAVIKIDPAVAAKEKMEIAHLDVRLGGIPNIKAPASRAATDEQAKRIKALIAKLAEIKEPDFGLSATLSGDSFSPLPGQSRATTFLFTNHDLKPSDEVKALVAMGPAALPFLLDALDDKTPTKMTVQHEGDFGAMEHAAELYMNPVNPAEAATCKVRARERRDDDSNYVKEYTLKVGDVCFVAIGQIVGRSYQAVALSADRLHYVELPGPRREAVRPGARNLEE